MPRQARLDIEGALHHVMVRGIEGRDIFTHDGDREDFVRRLAAVVEDTGLRIYAWVLMPNHAHLVVRTGPVPLSRCMRKLLTGYAVFFNQRHRRKGHLFQNRYKSILVEEETYFLELVRYVHLNPVRSHFLEGMDSLDDFAWSGHRTLVGKSENHWQDTKEVLVRFSNCIEEARCLYRNFVYADLGAGHREELSGGGLLRSLRGEAVVLAHGRGRERWAFDERILGESDFVERVWAEACRQHDLPPAEWAIGQGLETLAERVAARFQVSVEELCSGSRRRPLPEARRWVAWIAVRKGRVPQKTVAAFLGVSRQTISRDAGRTPSGAGGPPAPDEEWREFSGF